MTTAEKLDAAVRYLLDCPEAYVADAAALFGLTRWQARAASMRADRERDR